jgi:hypothetical protein
MANPCIGLQFHVPVTGCIWGIHAPNPSGGEAVQIGCPADLSGIPAGMTGDVATPCLTLGIAAYCALCQFPLEGSTQQGVKAGFGFLGGGGLLGLDGMGS